MHIKTRLIAFIGLALVYAYAGCKCTEFDVAHAIGNIKIPVKVLGEDIVYTERQVYDLKAEQSITIPLKMDIICQKDVTKSTAPCPLIIYFHGYNPIAYFKHSAESYKYYKQDTHDHIILDFARKHHCVVALVEYVPAMLKWEDAAIGFTKNQKCNKDYIPLIDQTEDSRNWYFMTSQAKDAIRFLKTRHTEYNFDINNITLVGFSAGGGIAAGAAFINDPAFRPAYSLEQPAVTYNSSNSYNENWATAINLVLFTAGKKETCKSYTKMPAKFQKPIPRFDLGSIEGRNTSNFNSSVKNVALICSGLQNSIQLTANGPRLFIYGSDHDEKLVPLQQEAQVSCSNKNPFSIFSEIKNKALSAGYQENVNLKVIQANSNFHGYKNNDMLAGSYPNVVEAIWAFIK